MPTPTTRSARRRRPRRNAKPVTISLSWMTSRTFHGRLEIVARDDLQQIGRYQLAFGSGIIGGVGPVIERNLNVDIEFEDAVIGLVENLGELDAGRDHQPVEAAVERIGGVARIAIAVRGDDLAERRDLVEAEY